MAFKSLKDLTVKELIMYGIVGFGFGAMAGWTGILLVEVIGSGLVLLGWVCLIWGIIRFFTQRTKKTESK